MALHVECQQNQEKCPAKHFLYIECIFRKFANFCLNGLIFKNQEKF